MTIGPTYRRERIRNFCIIAHIDHGKSTLADRILEFTGAVPQEDSRELRLDTMDLERERGITIKMQAVRMDWRAADGQEYVLNLIDTPGHVDFTYEVSRSLAACEGALLVVDAAQGVEAQTVANLYLARENGLRVIPVINKIDLPQAQPESIQLELIEWGFDPDECLLVSAKTGKGIPDLLEAVVERVPPPTGDPEAPLRALVFDSHYDPYRGVVAHLRVMDGTLAVQDRIRMMAGEKEAVVDALGTFRPDPTPAPSLAAGEVGYCSASMKDIRDCRVGDTMTHAGRRSSLSPLPGYRPARPMVYAGLYPAESEEYDALREALEKLHLNDAALTFEPETSEALGFGFRCGFLGLLHLEIVQERLEREYRLDLVTTAPSAVYRVRLRDGRELAIDNPARLPAAGEVERIEEPIVRAEILVPPEYVGPVMELCQDRRGNFLDMSYREERRALLRYELPLAEVMFDFFDQLKSRSRGYATLDYRFSGYRPGDLVRLDILVQGERVDALSTIVHRDVAFPRGRTIVEQLRDLIPRQQFEVPVQAAIGSKVIARETIRALRKNVLSKCYGGDVTRKRKLLAKQKEGKRRMRQVGSVEIPQDAFMAVLRVKDNESTPR